MDEIPEMVMPNELSQTEEKYRGDIPYTQNLKRSVTNAFTKQKQIHRGEEWGKDREFGINTYTLLYLK